MTSSGTKHSLCLSGSPVLALIVHQPGSFLFLKFETDGKVQPNRYEEVAVSDLTIEQWQCYARDTAGKQPICVNVLDLTGSKYSSLKSNPELRCFLLLKFPTNMKFHIFGFMTIFTLI